LLNSAAMLQLDHLSLRRGPRLLIDDASLQIHPGQRVGLTGANGAGKSSLFALILGAFGPDAGSLKLPKDWVIAHVAQQTPADARPAIEYALDGDAELRAIEAQLAAAEQADDGHRLASLHERMDHIGGYQARARAARLLHGLGFRPGDEERPVNDFSGGWRMRLNLAKALMCRSDLLLLDEPTNHLDLDAVLWLEDWLTSYPGTLLLISHDRDFLDNVVNQVAHIEQGQLTLYTGNYTAFERARAERLANQQAAYDKQQREIAHMQAFVDRFRAKATKARQAQSRLKALERMTSIAPAHVDSPFHFAFAAPLKNPRPLLRLDEVAAGYGDTPILSGAQFSLNPGDRVGLLGPNGAGKSTLIRLLAGELQPLAGERLAAQDLAIGYFAQHQLEQLHPEHSALQHLQQLDPKASEQALRDFVGGFGFQGERATCAVAPFSGGEKARLVLALLVYQKPNLLLLDEPTNHLDLEMRLALAEALQEFEGAMVIVSHDRHLLRVTCDQLLLVHGGRVRAFDGDLEDYPRWLAEQQRQADAAPVMEKAAESATERKARKRDEAAQRKQLQPLRQQLQRWEKQMEQLSAQQAELATQLGEPDIYDDGNRDRLKTLLADKAKIDSALEEAEAEWLAAAEQLEQAQAEQQ
jgi:ATP-binding cassette subfamily F protein 3